MQAITEQKLITKMEFHEFKVPAFSKPIVELYTYVSDLKEFLKACVGNENWETGYGVKAKYEHELKTINGNRKHFEIYFKHTKIEVYPKQNLIVSRDGGLHYICQHLFDFLPESIHSNYYPCSKRFDWLIGKLYVETGRGKVKATWDVKASDIMDGFMLSSSQIPEYDDTFSVWVASRRRVEAKEANKQ